MICLAEMVVQPAINPKKASGQYGSRRATIGKGVSTLDDFEEYNDVSIKLNSLICVCTENNLSACARKIVFLLIAFFSLLALFTKMFIGLHEHNRCQELPLTYLVTVRPLLGPGDRQLFIN